MANPYPLAQDTRHDASAGAATPLHRPTYRSVCLGEYDYLLLQDTTYRLELIAHVSGPEDLDRLLEHLNR